MVNYINISLIYTYISYYHHIHDHPLAFSAFYPYFAQWHLWASEENTNNKCLVFSCHHEKKNTKCVRALKISPTIFLLKWIIKIINRKRAFNRRIYAHTTHQFIVRFHSFLFTTFHNMSLVYCHTLILKVIPANTLQKNKSIQMLVGSCFNGFFFDLKYHQCVDHSSNFHKAQCIWRIFKKKGKITLTV